MVYLSIDASDFENSMKKAAIHHFIEYRFDNAVYSKAKIFKLIKLPEKAIAACRPGYHDDEKRLEILENSIKAGAAYIDIELESESVFRQDLLKPAQKAGCTSIISHHNIECTPSIEELRYILKKCFEAGADIAKIACMAQSADDAARMLSLYDNPARFFGKNRTFIAFSLGSEGRFTRVASLLLGAPFTYAAFSENCKTAPGQMTIAAMKKLMNLFVIK
ncbi:MAG: 3-dehydroquinate dehydratase [Bacteroidota bacterium]|nr:3-dehydroquinate dehydratase [Bacteroidota bacterium]